MKIRVFPRGVDGRELVFWVGLAVAVAFAIPFSFPSVREIERKNKEMADKYYEAKSGKKRMTNIVDDEELY